MLVNMACPKCGGQATQNENKQWHCLSCGNEFVLATDPSQMLFQSSVQILGQPNFELNVAKARQPFPKIVKMSEHDPNFFGRRIADNALTISVYQRAASRNKIIKTIALVMLVTMWLFGGFVLVPIVKSYKTDSYTCDLAIMGLIFLANVSPILIFALIYCRKEIFSSKLEIQKFEQMNLSLAKQNLMDIKIGDYIVCPCCEAILDFFAIGTSPPKEGLKHCPKCGRQFFTKDLNSFPVLFNK